MQVDPPSRTRAPGTANTGSGTTQLKPWFPALPVVAAVAATGITPISPYISVACCVLALVLALGAGFDFSIRLPEVLAVCSGIVVLAAMSLSGSFVDSNTVAAYYFAAISVFLTVRLLGTHRQVVIAYLVALELSGVLALVMIVSAPEGIYAENYQWTYTTGANYSYVDLANRNLYAYIVVAAAAAAVIHQTFGRVNSKVAKVGAFGMAASAVWATEHLDARGALIAALGVALLSLLPRSVRCTLGSQGPVSALLVLTFGLVVLWPVLYTALPLLGLEQVTSASSADLSGRLEIWPAALALIGESPAVGYGLGAGPALLPQNVGAHNITLTWLLEFGVAGFCILIATVASALWICRRGSRSRLVGFGIVVVVIALTPIVLSGHFETALAMWCLIAVGSRLDRLEGPGAKAAEPSADIDDVELSDRAEPEPTSRLAQGE